MERNWNAYDRGDYNSSFAIRAVQLKSRTRKKGIDLWIIDYLRDCCFVPKIVYSGCLLTEAIQMSSQFAHM